MQLDEEEAISRFIADAVRLRRNGDIVVVDAISRFVKDAVVVAVQRDIVVVAAVFRCRGGESDWTFGCGWVRQYGRSGGGCVWMRRTKSAGGCGMCHLALAWVRRRQF